MLAGRKLLLADDSATIQKVIDLTFADEGVRVVAVGNGRDAIDQLLEVVPDIVLADVFMPSPNGYEVCEYVKTNEKLKHIPVVLLVGSFEPFDEAEARRVGADDTLTKPFQSIRKLIDKVGGLMSGRQPQEEVATAELPQVDSEEPEKLSTEEIEISTADTRPLPAELEEIASKTAPAAIAAAATLDAATNNQYMEPPSMSAPKNGLSVTTLNDQLLDLDDLAVSDVIDEEFVLDLDSEEDEPYEVEVSASGARAFVEPQVTEAREFSTTASEQPEGSYPQIAEQFAETQEILPGRFEEETVSEATSDYGYGYQPSTVEYAVPQASPDLVRVDDETESVAPQAAATAEPQAMNIDPGQLSPEMIDAIARRVVEHMSDKVVQEIAWEVVPHLAELMIKRQLEEKKP